MKAQDDAFIEEIAQQEIDEAKLQGLDATRKAINSWNHNEGYNWQLMAVSNETANKLLQGEFTTLENLLDYDDSQKLRNTNINIHLLYRTIENKNRNEQVFIIETIFIDE